MTRNFTICLLVLLCLVVSVYSDSPWFCHDLDCPKFKVIKKSEEYSIREYQGAIWASTLVTSNSYNKAISTGFMRLYKYIDGGNVPGKKIEMTAPVHVNIEGASNGKKNYTISFFLPFKYQKKDLKDIPQPKEHSRVFLHKVSSFKVAVHEFGGFIFTEKYLLAKIDKLRDLLDDDDVDYKEESVEMAGYDPPFRLRNRHNEVWVKL